MDYSLKDKNIWITGGTKGIGAATALKAATKGANIIISGSKNINDYKNQNDFPLNKSQLKNISYIKADMANLNDLEHANKIVNSQFGNIDIFVNNAGIGIFKPTLEFTQKEIDAQININLRASIYLVQNVAKQMSVNGNGTIINILSIAVLKAFQNSAIYAANKAAIEAMSNSLREELRCLGLKIVNIYPGATITDIWDTSVIEGNKNIMMHPEDAADVICTAMELSLNPRMMLEEIVFRPQLGDL